MDSEKKTMADIEDGRQVMAISHYWDRPVPIFSDLRFSYLALVQDKKNHVRFTIKCILYSLCQLHPPPQFSMPFLFKINNSLYISFQSFINMQILTISHIILFQSMFVSFEWIIECSPLLVTNVKIEITSLWPNSNIFFYRYLLLL